MSLKTFIQEKIMLPAKWKHYKRNKPIPEFIALNKAKKIGIITDFREPSLIRIVSDFYKKIKKDGTTIGVAALLNEERKDFNQFEYERQFPGGLVFLVASDEIDRWERVNRKGIQPFLDEKYDIIFFLDRSFSFTLYDIILSTSSKMVAGRISEGIEIVDFGIELSTSSPLENLTDNLYKYLTDIRVGEKPAAIKNPELKLI